VNNYISISIWGAVILAVFGIAWYMGYLTRLRDYVLETREELKKCTWPTWEELQGSTLLVAISIGLLGGFTVAVNYFCNVVVGWIS
jgi:preprotein translocase subunit SecE